MARSAEDRQRERELTKAAQAGDQRALEQLIAMHDPFLRTLASRCQSFSGSDFEEIHGAAVRGFVEGTLKFDLGRPNRLLTYVTWYCRKHIRQALREQGAFRKHRPVQWSAVDSQETPVEIVQDEAGPEHAVEFEELLGLAVQGLPPFAQEVFRAKFESNQYLSEVALSQHFGVSLWTIRTAVNTIVVTLKAHGLVPQDATIAVTPAAEGASKARARPRLPRAVGLKSASLPQAPD